jgi:hypothetical protein
MAIVKRWTAQKPFFFLCSNHPVLLLCSTQIAAPRC